MNELISTLNQVLEQRFEEYNRILINLLKMDTQMIVSMANKTNPQDEQVKNLITQLNDLIKLIERNGMAPNQEFLYLSIRHCLREIFKKASGEIE
ncbi:MAG: hypothetical protein WBV73_14985 [Phormidium sp.]